jgi:diguanylate cyclase (GGDEF)-like protein
MLEKVLIGFLAFLVVILLYLAWRRRRDDKGTIQLSGAAIDELMKAMLNNIKAGRISDIAGMVSNVLKEYLACEKILFLKYYRAHLEVNFMHGLLNPQREKLRLKVTPDLQNKLKAFNRIADINELSPVLPDANLKYLQNLGLGYYFPVYLRDNLYGLYFVKTNLSLNNPSLQFLSTALAFSLSTAYHIVVQEQQLKKYEDRVQKLMADHGKKSHPKTAPSREVIRLLKIKNSRQLIPELMATLRKECEFSKLAFYVQSDASDESIISACWNIDADSDRTLKENYVNLAENIETDRIFSLDELSKSEKGFVNQIRKLKDNELKYLTAINWGGKKKAILAWNGQMAVEDVTARLKCFSAEAIPLMENAVQFEKVEEMCHTDGLTGLHNFRYFQKRMYEEFMRAQRYKRNLALLIFDIDDLKLVNDKYGHLAGDALLKSFGQILSDSVRSIDVVSRYGGDEFCLIMPEANRQKAGFFMERIREKIASNQVESHSLWGEEKYSVSIGAAVYPIDANTVENLINSADMALLKAKSEGRNCSKLYTSEMERKE